MSFAHQSPSPLVRRHQWAPGEKKLFSARNDIHSLTLSLAVMRARNQTPARVAEMERVSRLLDARKADLLAIAAEFGLDPNHCTAAEADPERAGFEKRKAETLELAEARASEAEAFRATLSKGGV